MSYLIQSRRLCKRLGEKNLLSDVEVHVPQGRVARRWGAWAVLLNFRPFSKC